MSKDLHQAALHRLQHTTVAAERLMRLELENTQRKYANFALEPRFRAILEANDIPTLDFYAQELVKTTKATAVVFTNALGETLVSAGEYIATPVTPVFPTGLTVTSVSLRTASLTDLFLHNNKLIVSTKVPLKTSQRQVGFLLTQQEVPQETLDEWADLLGVQLIAGQNQVAPAHTPNDLVAPLQDFSMIWVVMSNQAEAKALSDARFHVLFSLVGALLVSVVISYFFADKLTKSIVLIQQALETLGNGIFDIKLNGDRQDEIGDINRSTQHLAKRLEDSRSRLVEMDHVHSLNKDLSRQAEQLAFQKQQIESRQVLLQQSMLDLQQANNQMQLYLQCLEATQESIVIINGKGTIQYINPFCLVHNQYDRHELFGRDYSIFIPEKDRENLCLSIWRVLEKAHFWQAEVHFEKSTQEIYPVDVTITRVKTFSDTNESYIMVFRDISVRAEFEAQLIEVANHDELTGLLNRRCFEQQIKMSIGLHQPSEDKFAVLWLDLDRFKLVNDTYGHQIGDELLIEITTALKKVLRSNDQVARMGGDEFAFLLMFVNHKTALEIAHKLLEEVRQYTKTVEGDVVTVGGSFGVALYPDDGVTVKDLLKASDIAMYQAKRRGRDQVCVYNGSSH